MKISLLGAGVLVGLLCAGGSRAEECTLFNPTRRDLTDELVRLKMLAPGAAGTFVVKEEGQEAPYQVEEIDGKPYIWICSGFAPNSSRKYEVAPGAPQATAPRVGLKKEGPCYVLDNGNVAVRVPAEGAGEPPGPITAVRLGADKWVGSSAWKTASKLKDFSATVIGDGTLFAKVRLRYEFDEMAGVNGDVPAFATVDVALGPGWQHVEVFERHEMKRGAHWEFAATQGWDAKQGVGRPFAGGFGERAPPPNRELKPIVHTAFREDMYLNLFPRWNQGCKDGWLFAATNGQDAVGAAVVRASRWIWPHNNAIEVIVRGTGDYAGLRCPTWKGQRLWWLLAGPQTTVELGQGYVMRYAFEHLDKLNHEVLCDWPGQMGSWGGPWAFGGIDPTGGLRGEGRNAVAKAGSAGNYGTLARMQSMMHPDVYGTYWNYWSPENPNFFTDFFRPPIAYATHLKAHPRFDELRRQAELKFKEDLYHSITLPGGAGQECPGYVGHALEAWKALAPICKQYLGFDPTTWERYQVAQRFLQRISHPHNGARLWLHMGDTHPLRRMTVDDADLKSWATTEFPGFGVIFNSKPGTPDETYLSFKSGPNRGHFHGDQLSIHFCAHASNVAVDHHCSYHPHSAMEHMHNRVAFHTAQLPYANMDGFERLIAFKTSPDVDVAVGQVESERLRQIKPTPPGTWHHEYPQLRFDKLLCYRRTIVFMKNGPQDYVVLRDQFWAPVPLKATYCLHVLTDKMAQKGQAVEFGNMTLLCAQPAGFDFESFPWQHSNGGLESTQGARLTMQGQQGEFVTVLYAGKPPAWNAIAGGIKVGSDEITFAGDAPTAGDATTYVTVKRAGKATLTLIGEDINLDRSQGHVGLFVPDAGYPFGVIPDWLVKQRAGKDEWATKTDEELRK